ncbi:cytochrome P450 [Plantactinospora sp. B6F1]|uniref:cytochrome P450 n=1 Tax=Plantactinospora sp. B6F1 TaxID=3158971 RepID=UPI0010DF8DA1
MSTPAAGGSALSGSAYPDLGDLSRIDLADPMLLASDRRYEVWDRLRRHRPVHWQSVADAGTADGFWSVTRYADVCRVLADHARFTSERGTLLNLLGRRDPAAGQQMAATDPPRHGRMRLPVQRAMGLSSARNYEREVRAGVRLLLADHAAGGPFDAVTMLAGLPLTVLGPLLGVPTADWPELARLAAMCTAEDDPAYQLPEGAEATLRRGHRALFGYFSDLARKRARQGGDDLVSLLLRMDVDGQRLGRGAVVSNCYSLLLGASVTLPHVPTAALAHLAGTDRYAHWARRPDLLNSGVEEALRWASPASHFMRVARHPVELSGVTVAAGEAVVAWLGSANRDPAVFSQPDRFDVRRTPNRHLAFGTGRHYCIGSHLARLALRLFFAELFATFESLTPDGEPVRVRSTFLSGYQRLPLRGQPRRRDER